ncbi:MAG: Glycosyl transferase group 1 [candidate division WS6 bacterium GW2011_GWA2_37_6]|uniref:Glycosyl transferase group 1 n=1 Tax=candidate division WS6 bacterium GW2011_GWA2_37_6 TaxID=1619087 RepID=A0A0G0HBQ1_9BACT|nr:MAG: Glycosyl transferase group 1 [candidate division WS6 bacterium GW2011_GWA2_37_6]
MKSVEKDLKVAITHDYLIEYGGAEVVLRELLKLFPKADLYTAIYKEDKSQRELWIEVSRHKIYTSFVNKLPLKKIFWKILLPLHIRFFRNLDLSGYDLVISSSAGFAKFIEVKAPTKHIAYIHTPPRFLWGFETSFFHKIPFPIKALLKPILKKWNKLDYYYARKASLVVTNSRNIQEKIHKCYGINAKIVYPPVDIESILKAQEEPKQNFYLVVSRLHKYKNIDLIIKAFNKNRHKLIIVGDGPERKYLKEIAGSNIEFEGFIDEQAKIRLLKQAKAFLFAAEEDFGIVMVEALAAGTPVIAYAKGGALEIIKEGSNGIFFSKQDPDLVNDSIIALEKLSFRKSDIVQSARNFSSQIFEQKIEELIAFL